MFVKTSSRSPKDSPSSSTKFKHLYATFLSESNPSARNSENEQIFCLLRAAFQSLRVSSGSEAIDMCLKSERIYQDMLLALTMSHRFRENFVIRRFRHIDVDMEFRAFVFGGRLTAVCQYNHLIHSERLCKEKDSIVQLIRAYFDNEVSKRLTDAGFLANYVIDFAVFSSKIWQYNLLLHCQKKVS